MEVEDIRERLCVIEGEHKKMATMQEDILQKQSKILDCLQILESQSFRLQSILEHTPSRIPPCTPTSRILMHPSPVQQLPSNTDYTTESLARPSLSDADPTVAYEYQPPAATRTIFSDTNRTPESRFHRRPPNTIQPMSTQLASSGASYVTPESHFHHLGPTSVPPTLSTTGYSPSESHSHQPLPTPALPDNPRYTPEPYSIRVGENVLPSSTILKDKLASVAQIINNYPKLRCESKAGTLAVKVAKNAVFGESVMKRCTVMGERDLPGLPPTELMELKRILFKQFPHLWTSRHEFEPIWKVCVDSLGQACKRLRQK